MANLSQERRKKMIEFLEKLRQEHSDDASIIAFNEIETALTEKKYGLVWEEHTEQVDEELKNKIPVFVEDKSREIVSDPELPYNFLLEGDNLHSLKLLEKTHKGKIDVIYIDPPYNTGGNDFTYNDTKIGNEDDYRHSKWLSFMNERLDYAKRLLNDTGLIFISIGEDECYNLKLLLDEKFGLSNLISCVTRIAKRTSNKGNFFKPTKDYLIVYAKNKENINWKFGVINPVDEKDFKYEDENGKYKKNGASLYQPSLDSRPNQRYYIKCPDGSLIIPPGEEFPVEKLDGAFVRPKSNKDKCWRWSLASYLKQKDRLIFTKASKRCPLIDSNGNPAKWNIYDKVYFKKKDGEYLLPEDVIYDFVNSQGTKEVIDLGLNFSFAKPVGLIKYIIKLLRMNKNINILDFFAGSGTTAQAVMELNNEDGGQRKFILCTNNENNICTDVTYIRCKTVITGVRQDGSQYSDGIPANLKYYKTDFIPRFPEDESISDSSLQYVKELIQLQNAINIDNKNYALILDDEEADEILIDKKHCDQYKAIYISSSVLQTAKQKCLLNATKAEVYSVPDYYFETELREAGELC